MGLSFSVSRNIQLIPGAGQNLSLFVYMYDSERIVSFQPTERELPYEQILKQHLFEISVNILPFRKFSKCIEKSIFIFKRLWEEELPWGGYYLSP